MAHRSRPLALRGPWASQRNRWVSVAFSRDGTQLAAASRSGTVQVWELRPETRALEVVERLVRCHGIWRLDAGHLVPGEPDPAACKDGPDR